MGKIRVEVNNVEVLDFNPSDLGVAISWQAKLIEQINTFKVTKTKTISLPLSKALSKALDYPLILDSPSYLDLTEKPTVKIYEGNELLINGFAKINNAKLSNLDDSIEFIVEPIGKGFFEALQDVTMQDIDLSDYDHVLESATVYDSQFGTYSDPVIYAPINTGYVGYRSILGMSQTLVGSTYTTTIYYVGEEVDTPNEDITIVGCKDSAANGDCQVVRVSSTYWNSAGVYVCSTTDLDEIENTHLQRGYFQYNDDREWKYHDFAPLTPISLIFERLVKSVGYNLNSTWIENNLDDKYHWEWNSESWARAFDKRHGFVCGVVEDDFHLTSPFSGITTYPFVNVERDGLLVNSDYDDLGSDDLATVQGNTHRSYYEPSEDVFMYFEVNVRLFALIDSVTLGVYNKTTGLLVYTIDSNTGSGVNHDFILSGVAYVATGNVVQVLIDFDGASFEPYFLTDSYFEGHQIPKMIADMNVHPSEFMTPKTGYEWFKDLSVMFNFQVFIDEYKKELIVMPDEDKLNGKIVSFVSKLDTNSDITITPLKDTYDLKNNFNYLSDENDFEVLKRELASGVRIGRGEINNLNVFKTKTVESDLVVYSATVNNQADFYDFSWIGCPIMRGEEQERLDYQSRVLKVEIEKATPQQYVEGVLTSLEFHLEGNTDTSYNYASFPGELHFENLISTYYARFKDQLDFGFLVTGKFAFNTTDIQRFNNLKETENPFRWEYIIKLKGVDVKCELIKITDYQPATNNLTEATLLCQIRRN